MNDTRPPAVPTERWNEAAKHDPEGDAERPFFPDLTLLTRQLQGPLGTVAIAVTGLFTLALFYTLYVAKAVFLPVVLAVLLNFLLSPIVRLFERRRVPAPLGALIVLIALLGTMAAGIYHLALPASEWIDKAPQSLRQAEYKLRSIRASLEKVEQATEEIEKITNGGGAEDTQQVEVQDTPLSDTLLNQTQNLLAGGVVLVFLLYFLLASSDSFLRKLVQVLPKIRHKRNAVTIIRHTENDLSDYFLTVTLVNIGLGCAVALALFLLGMPNPILWGVLAAFLNFIPYLGGLVGITVIGLVALVSFDSLGHALLAPLSYLLLNTLEAYVVTPIILGRRLMLNPVSVFTSIIFWGWIWGVPGAILAVPLLVSFKIICDNIEVLSAIGAFLER